jgi:hypothetical protein
MKLWHFLGIVPTVLWRDREMPHNTLIKMADFQIEFGAWNLSVLALILLMWRIV